LILKGAILVVGDRERQKQVSEKEKAGASSRTPSGVIYKTNYITEPKKVNEKLQKTWISGRDGCNPLQMFRI